MWSFLGTLGGLSLVTFGVACSIMALVGQARDHGREPFEEAIARVRLASRRLGYRIMPWRRRNIVVHDAAVAMEASSALSVKVVVGGPAVPSEVAVDEQIRLLVQRIENVERQADHDRADHIQQARALRERIESLDARTLQADEHLKQVARTIAVGTIELQLWGLFLVGAGTIVMAVSSMFA